MTEEISLDEVQRLIGQVKHPAIDSTLVELGMVRDVALDGRRATLTLAIPFEAVPQQIRDMLIGSLQRAVEALGVELSADVAVMSEAERQHFLETEQRNWKGL